MKQGVTFPKAHAIAQRVSAVELQLGLDWLEKYGKTAQSRAGLLVKIFEDGTTANLLAMHDAEQEKRQKCSHDLARRSLDQIACSVDSMEETPLKRELIAIINSLKSVYSTADAVIRARLIPIEEIQRGADSPARVLRMLDRACKARDGSGSDSGRPGGQEIVNAEVPASVSPATGNLVEGGYAPSDIEGE